MLQIHPNARTTPFVRARFENTNWTTSNHGLSVVLDNLTFSSIPEPTFLAACGLSLIPLARRRR